MIYYNYICQCNAAFVFHFWLEANKRLVLSLCERYFLTPLKNSGVKFWYAIYITRWVALDDSRIRIQ
jgi:hypothetical protein